MFWWFIESINIVILGMVYDCFACTTWIYVCMFTHAHTICFTTITGIVMKIANSAGKGHVCQVSKIGHGNRVTCSKIILEMRLVEARHRSYIPCILSISNCIYIYIYTYYIYIYIHVYIYICMYLHIAHTWTEPYVYIYIHIKHMPIEYMIYRVLYSLPPYGSPFLAAQIGRSVHRQLLWPWICDGRPGWSAAQGCPWPWGEPHSWMVYHGIYLF